MLKCLIFEDDHLLVANKPAGLNTHSPSPYAGEGLFDWLRHREPRWANLAIIHRLDKETSGVIVFSKTRTANRSLTQQFASRSIRKQYLLVTDREAPNKLLTVKTSLIRCGDKYLSRPPHPGADLAETHFLPSVGADVRRLSLSPHSTLRTPHSTFLLAEPLTGRTHQIRVHAADHGFPVLGDTLYGGTPAPRVCLHAAALTLRHPATNEEVTFRAPVDFGADPRLQLRGALLDPEATNAYRLVHGASDGWPGWYVDRLGDYLLSQSSQPLTAAQQDELKRLMGLFSARGAYHKLLTARVGRATPVQTSPQFMLGEPAPERFTVRENGLHFELSFNEGYSVGLFLDQRDNRRRLLTSHIAATFPLVTSAVAHPQFDIRHSTFDILNAFSYTCGFSVCAAKAGVRTTNLDLSKKHLEWGKRNFALNRIDPACHDFLLGDVFNWLRRLTRKQRTFDVILLDPPTFSRSRDSGPFRVEKDYGNLVSAALPLLKTGGVLFASTNAAEWTPEAFLTQVERAIRAAGASILQRHYVPQPPDFPISRSEPAHLKTAWFRIERQSNR